MLLNLPVGFLLLSLFPVIYANKIIPPKKLNKKEQQDIQKICNRGSVSNRIIGGNAAQNGMFKFAVFLELSNNMVCGASLISWRHAVTARHCVEGDWSVKLFVGGVCLKSGTDSCRFGPYLEELVIDSIFYISSKDDPSLGGDHAIIQLKKPVAKELRDRVDIICLPRKNEPIPDRVLILGWGVTERNYLPENLRYTTVTTTTKLNDDPDCKDDRLVCATRIGSPDSSGRAGIGQGDSGSGAIFYSDARHRPILHAISVANDRHPLHRDVSVFVRVSKLLDFYCKTLALCVP